MHDAENTPKSLRERLPLSGGAGGATEERLGRALSDLLESPLLSGAIGRAFDVREKAVQAQEVAMGALNIPSAADIERLTRRLRSVSLRLEGIEEGVDRVDRTLTGAGGRAEIVEHLTAIERQLARLDERLERLEARIDRIKPDAAAEGAAAKGAGAEGAAAGAEGARAARSSTRARTSARRRAAKPSQGESR
jgi:DNA-binding transcriptional MerR regulator